MHVYLDAQAIGGHYTIKVGSVEINDATIETANTICQEFHYEPRNTSHRNFHVTCRDSILGSIITINTSTDKKLYLRELQVLGIDQILNIFNC